MSKSLKHRLADYETSIRHFENVELSTRDELYEVLRMMDFAKHNRRIHEQLFQLHQNGPIYDGDLICKSDRTDLMEIGACAKVYVKGQDGYNACTYFGRTLLGIFDWLYGPLTRLEASEAGE